MVMRNRDASFCAGGRRRPVFCASPTIIQPDAPSIVVPQTFWAHPAQPLAFRTPSQLVPQLLLSSPPTFQCPPSPFPDFQMFSPRIPSIQTLSAAIPPSQTSPAPFGSFQYPLAAAPSVSRLDYVEDPAAPLHAAKRMRCDVPANFFSPSSYSFPNPSATNLLLSGGVRPGGHQSVMIHSTDHNSHNSLLTQAPVNAPLSRTHVVSTSPFSVHHGSLSRSLGSQESLKRFLRTDYMCKKPSVELKQGHKPKQKKKKEKLKRKLFKLGPKVLMQEAAKLNKSKQKTLEARPKKKLRTVSTPNESKGKKSELGQENMIQNESHQNDSKQRKSEASPENIMQEPDGLELLPEILMLQMPKQKEPKQKKLKPKKVKIESYYCKSMVVDPWQHLKPVTGSILEPLAGPWSWLPESLTAGKEKAPPQSNFEFDFNSTDISLFDVFDTCVQEVLKS